eukprot:1516195-Rhodomonas_salina.2
MCIKWGREVEGVGSSKEQGSSSVWESTMEKAMCSGDLDCRDGCVCVAEQTVMSARKAEHRRRWVRRVVCRRSALPRAAPTDDAGHSPHSRSSTPKSKTRNHNLGPDVGRELGSLHSIWPDGGARCARVLAMLTFDGGQRSMVTGHGNKAGGATSARMTGLLRRLQDQLQKIQGTVHTNSLRLDGVLREAPAAREGDGSRRTKSLPAAGSGHADFGQRVKERVDSEGVGR